MIVQVAFTTDAPLTQETGAEFWRHGQRFGLATRAYGHPVLSYAFTTSIVADDVVTGVALASALVSSIMARCAPEVSVTIVRVSAELALSEIPA